MAIFSVFLSFSQEHDKKEEIMMFLKTQLKNKKPTVFMEIFESELQKIMLTQSLQKIKPSISESSDIVDISFRNIVYEVEARTETGEKFRKTILHGVSGIFKSGELNVIMGASGAGKTTLLNILACRITDFAGELLANDTAYDFRSFGGFANYVMQGDVLMETMTVRETLEFAAHLKIPDWAQAQQKIGLLVRQLKLEKCLDVVVGGNILKGASGGEKKRTAIAVELLSDPRVIVLDEPTSGMDSLTSFIIVNELRTLAQAGRTVFLTIHQPNAQIYALFDNLLLLVEGRAIYQGKTHGTDDYFANNFGLKCPEFINHADFYMSIMHQEDERNTARYEAYFNAYDQQIAKGILAKIQQRQKTPIEPRSIQRNFFYALKILLKRDLINIIRNPIVMQSRIFQVIFISIYTAGLYFNAGRADYTDIIKWQAIIGYLFFISMDLFMQAMMPVTISFPAERLVFLKQENSKMYSIGQYFMSRNIIQIPYIVLIPFIFLFISYWMIGLGNTPEQFFTMYFIIFLMSFSATSAGMFVGSLVRDPKLISTLISLLALPLLTFSGFFKNYNSLPVWIGWIRFISPFNYAYTSLVKNQTLYKPGLVDTVNFQMSLWTAILLQFCLSIAFRLAAFFFLLLKKDKLQ